VTFHRKQRNKKFLHSVLDDIPGIGAKRKTALLKHFKDVRHIRNASLDALAAVPGMNRSISKRVQRALAVKKNDDGRSEV
jgi:excinuclease ABC subunit C